MRQAIMKGAHQGARGATNLARVSKVTQKPEELLSQFCECLRDAYCWCTPFDPEAPKNQSMINTAFVQQSASDVRQKLQKMKGFTGANIDQLISIAAKVKANQEKMDKRERKKNLGKKAKILAMTLKEGDGKTRGRREAQQERMGKPSGKNTSVPNVRRSDI
jgi:hypothetical protein